jgi:signal transduction histidine kinase
MHAALRLQLEAAAKQAELDFLREEMPKSFDSILEGVTRVTNIIGAMKEFAHPDSNEQAPADINHAIRTAILVAAGEYKHTASILTDLATLPMVVCNIGEMNQVFLNLIVNAAHAVEAAGKDPSSGEIRISTAVIDDAIEIRIADNGCGVAPENLTKLYDPFFTTKAAGRGTGQGLAISYSILVDKHRGGISAKSTVGVGTEFTLRLPIRGRDTVGT